jgi:hypothetical protein
MSQQVEFLAAYSLSKAIKIHWLPDGDRASSHARRRVGWSGRTGRRAWEWLYGKRLLLLTTCNSSSERLKNLLLDTLERGIS